MTDGLKIQIDRTAVLLLLARAYNTSTSAFELQTGISSARWRLLFLVQRLGTCTQKQLIALINVDAGAVTRQLTQLERDGLIARVDAAHDKRLTNVSLTAEGRALVRRIMKKRREFLERMLEGVPPDEVAVFLKTLEKIDRNLAPR
ncbi:MAG: MarR family transcriptional regulator [Rhodoferax sp.]|nr:MarR family transcriptional regulator [Rhodoferax sp.]